MPATVRPFLMFQGQADAALSFYVSLFRDAKIIDIARYGPGAPGPEGTVMKASFSIAGQTIMCIDSPIKHKFTFTPAFSLFVDCESAEEVENLSGRWPKGARC